jgi:hypothetical protein
MNDLDMERRNGGACSIDAGARAPRAGTRAAGNRQHTLNFADHDNIIAFVLPAGRQTS